jgi:hypothetical protein
MLDTGTPGLGCFEGLSQPQRRAAGVGVIVSISIFLFGSQWLRFGAVPARAYLLLRGGLCKVFAKLLKMLLKCRS